MLVPTQLPAEINRYHPRLVLPASLSPLQLFDRLPIAPCRCLHDLVEFWAKEPPRFRLLFFHAGLIPEPLFDLSYEFLFPQYWLLVPALVKLLNLFFDLFM